MTPPLPSAPAVPRRASDRIRGSAASVATLVVVATFYTAVATAWTWPLARNLATHTAIQTDIKDGLARNDQAFSISAAARQAAAIRTGEWWRLIHWRTCYPMPKAATLGEHAIELGILALPGYLASGDPVVAYNSACLLLVLVAGLSTFYLVRHWTGSAAAGVVAGLAFAFHPLRVNDLVHPFVIGIHWLPLVLLTFDRLLETGRIRFALLLAIAGTLQSWVGAYPLLTFAAFAGPYGVVRLLQMRHTLDARRVLLLALAVAVMGAGAALVLSQYAGGSAWGVRRRQLLLIPFTLLMPGSARALGGVTVVLALLLVGLRGRRPSPVPGLVAGGLACVVLAGQGRLWPGGPRFAGVYPYLADHLWIFGIARVPGAIATGAYFAIAAMFGIALGRLLARMPAPQIVRPALATIVASLLLLEYRHPAITMRVYRTRTTTVLVPRQPKPRIVATYRAFDAAALAGPIVEIPFDAGGTGPLGRMPYYVQLAAYHGRETAACFTSHIPLAYHDVDRMVKRVSAPSYEGLVELAATGFRNVVIHHERGVALADELTRLPGVQVVYRAPQATAFHLTMPVSPHRDPGRLARGNGALRWFGFKGYWDPVVDVQVRNLSSQPWAAPHPLRPLTVRTRWIGAEGRPVTSWAGATTMLPLAIAGQASAAMQIMLDQPPPGCLCRPEIEIADLGWHLGSEEIDVSGWTLRPPQRRSTPGS